MLNSKNTISTITLHTTRGPSTHSGPGGNWPSTTGQPSGGGRGNAK